MLLLYLSFFDLWEDVKIAREHQGEQVVAVDMPAFLAAFHAFRQGGYLGAGGQIDQKRFLFQDKLKQLLFQTC